MHKEEHLRAHIDVPICLLDQLLPSPSRVLLATACRLQEQCPNLVSCSGSIVDQISWERVANPIIHTGSISGDASSVVEVSLFALIGSFVGNVTLPSLV